MDFWGLGLAQGGVGVSGLGLALGTSISNPTHLAKPSGFRVGVGHVDLECGMCDGAGRWDCVCGGKGKGGCFAHPREDG